MYPLSHTICLGHICTGVVQLVLCLCSWSYLDLYDKSLSTPIPWYVLEYQVEWPTIAIPLVRSLRVPLIIASVVTFTCSVLFLEHGGYTLILWFVLVWVLKYSRSTKPSSSWCYYITSPFFKRFALKSSKRDDCCSIRSRLWGEHLFGEKRSGSLWRIFVFGGFVPWFELCHPSLEEKHQMCYLSFTFSSIFLVTRTSPFLKWGILRRNLDAMLGIVLL